MIRDLNRSMGSVSIPIFPTGQVLQRHKSCDGQYKPCFPVMAYCLHARLESLQNARGISPSSKLLARLYLCH